MFKNLIKTENRPLSFTAVGMQVAAAGVFAFNIFPVVVAPFFGIEMEPIEWSNS